MPDTLDAKRKAELVEEGARVRVSGRPKDACLYPMDSAERKAWMEGFDGESADQAPDLPMGQS